MLENSISLVQIIKEMKQQEAQFPSIAFKYQLGTSASSLPPRLSSIAIWIDRDIDGIAPWSNGGSSCFLLTQFSKQPPSVSLFFLFYFINIDLKLELQDRQHTGS